MILPMSWNEWARHDGVALAARVKKGELTTKELASQAAAGIAKLNPALSGVVEVFEDAIDDPGKQGADLAGPFAGLPFSTACLPLTMASTIALSVAESTAQAVSFLVNSLNFLSPMSSCASLPSLKV